MENCAVSIQGRDHIVDIVDNNENEIEQTELRGTETVPDEAKNEYHVKTSNLPSLFKRFVETSTFHGFSRLTDSLVWVRMLWFLAIAGAIAALSLQINGLTNEYLSFKVLTSIDVEQGSIAFPSLTICNNRRYLASRIVSLPLFANMSAQVSDPSTFVNLTLKFFENFKNIDPEDFLHLGANASDTVAIRTNHGYGGTKLKPLSYHGSCYTVEPPQGTTLMSIVFNVHIFKRFYR